MGARDEVEEALDEGGLSASSSADDGDLFAGVDGDGDVFEDRGATGKRGGNGIRIG